MYTYWGVVDTSPSDWPEPSILLAAARLSPNILIHYLSPSIKPQSFHEGEKPCQGIFFQSLARSLPADNNERTRRRVRVKLFYLPHRSFSPRLLRSLFSASSSYLPKAFPH